MNEQYDTNADLRQKEGSGPESVPRFAGRTKERDQVWEGSIPGQVVEKRVCVEHGITLTHTTVALADPRAGVTSGQVWGIAFERVVVGIDAWAELLV